MASIRKRGKTWRAEVARNGVRVSDSFSTKAQAVAWSTEREAEIIAGKRGVVRDVPLRSVLERYADEVSPTKRGERWERLRLALIGRDALGAVRLPALDASHIAAWRDRRLQQVSAASVRREWTLLSHALTIAVKEWRWLAEHPMLDVRRPAPPPARDRRITLDEIERLLYATGYVATERPATLTARVGAAMLFAIETAMRAGEIAKLTDTMLDLSAQVAHLPKAITKNAMPRDVPLSTEAVRLIRQVQQPGVARVFGISSTQQIDALFRKAKARAMIEDLHFHDTRHEAITRLAKKLGVLDLARMVGHRDLKQLMVYYNEAASDIARRLG